MNNKFKLYNLIFPVWLLFIFPLVWLIVLPANFLIDSLVLLISMNKLKIDDKKVFYKKHIFKIFWFGIFADLIGALCIFLMFFIFHIGSLGDELYLTVPGLIIASIFIFIFNYFISFKNLDKRDRYKLALIYAIFTAPYTFLIPLSWIYF